MRVMYVCPLVVWLHMESSARVVWQVVVLFQYVVDVLEIVVKSDCLFLAFRFALPVDFVVSACSSFLPETVGALVKKVCIGCCFFLGCVRHIKTVAVIVEVFMHVTFIWVVKVFIVLVHSRFLTFFVVLVVLETVDGRRCSGAAGRYWFCGCFLF